MSSWNWTPRAKRIGWTLLWLEVALVVAAFAYVYLYGTPLA
jgi:hypothetical protein